MNNSTIYIALACDDNYAGFAAVAIKSVINTLDPNYFLNVTVFDGGISSDNLERISNLSVDNFITIRFFDTQNDISFDDLPTSMHWTKAMYYRLAVGDAIPSIAKKVIYLDCDVLVTKSLHYLYEIDLVGKWLGAVENPDSTRLRELGIVSCNKYFNSGILLIDMIVWRKQKLKDQAIKICNDNKLKLVSPDQDVLNILYAGNVKFLPYHWNMQVSMFNRRKYWRDIRDSQGIYHFTTNVKPWHADDPHPYANKFRSIARELEVPIAENRLSLVKLTKYCKRFICRYFLFVLSKKFQLR